MFLIPTGSTTVIDDCDIAFVLQTNTTSCRVTFSNGSSLAIAAALNDFANEINANYDPLLPKLVGPFTLGSSLGYFAGQQVRSAQPRAGAPLESLISFERLATVFVLPAPIAFVAALLNATSGCGGGGGASGVVAVAQYLPTVAGIGDVTATAAPMDRFAYNELQATDSNANHVNVTGSVNLVSAGGVVDAALAFINLPVNMSQDTADFQALCVTAYDWALGVPVLLAVQPVSETQVMVIGSLDAGVNVYASVNLTYARAAV